jgi:hypothetical protein
MLESLQFQSFAGQAATDKQAADWARLRRARFEELNPGDPIPTLSDFERQLRTPNMPGTEAGEVLAYVGGDVVAMGGWDVDTADNPQLLWVDVYVDGSTRRRGVGCRVLEQLFTVSDRPGLAEVGFGVSGHVPVGRSLQARLEGEWGLPVRMVERLARLDLRGLDVDVLAADLESRISRMDSRYTPLFFALDDLPPPETGFRLDRFCEMVEEIENLMPLEDLTMEPEHYTPEKFATQVESQRLQERVIWNYVLWDQEGERAVGLTNVAFKPADPRRVSQWATGVIKSAQGHSFGKILKLLMTVKLLREVPEAQYIYTENAASNDAMIAINTALGFEEHYRIHDYQMPLEDLKRHNAEAIARTAW